MKTSLNMKPASSWHVPGGLWGVLGTAAALIVVAVLGVALIGNQRGTRPDSTQASWPPAEWSVGTPEGHGIDSAKLAEGLLGLRESDTAVHSMLVVHDGSLLLDAYFYPYDGKTPHDLASVTKSIMTTLIGIAVDQGKLKLDDTMVSFFPERKIANLDARKERVTVRHLVSMSSGLDCTHANTEALQAEMRASTDWVQYALDVKVVSEPGTEFQYCGLGSHLLSGILRKATGVTALEYARQNLFGPLGISMGDVIWPADPQGNNHGWGDLALLPRDLAKIGYLWLNNGQSENEKGAVKQIISRQWVQDSVQPLLRADEDDSYGYGWWVGSASGPMEFSMEGTGGQTVMIYPDLKLMVGATAGGIEYDQVGNVLGSALADKTPSNKPLPANPVGVAKLNEALATIGTPKGERQLVPPLPSTAKAISGKTFVFDMGQPGVIKTLRLDFDNSAEAHIELAVVDDEPVRAGPVGLDGLYRISTSPMPNGLPEAYRGRWKDEQTFMVEYDRIGNGEGWVLTLRFHGAEGDEAGALDRVSLRGLERTGKSLAAEGRVKDAPNP